MGRNSGKNIHRRKHFAPPSVPKSLSAEHHFGIITRYHGRAERHMDVVVYNEHERRQERRFVSLKGSIRNMKCKQHISIGAYCLVHHDQVVVILTDSQRDQIPDAAFNVLTKVNQSLSTNANTDVDLLDADSIADDSSSCESEEDEVLFAKEDSVNGIKVSSAK